MPPVSHLLDLSGRVALVTGAGAGIGTGIARRLAEAGAAVGVHCRSSVAGAEAVADAITSGGGRASVVQGDLTDASSVHRVIADVECVFGLVDVLVNNVGIYPLSPLLEMPETQWNEVVDANLKSAHLLTQAFGRRAAAGRAPGPS